MRSLTSRIEQLEQRTGVNKAQMQVIVMKAGQPELALDADRCVEILSDCGFVLTGPLLLLEFGRVPDGLNAAQLERHLREHAAEICPAARRPSDQTRFAGNSK